MTLWSKSSQRQEHRPLQLYRHHLPGPKLIHQGAAREEASPPPHLKH